jgi:hypothetical protein
MNTSLLSRGRRLNNFGITRAVCSFVAGAALLSSLPAAHAQGSPPTFPAGNSVVTEQEQTLELRALKLLDSPVGREAERLSGLYLRNFVGVSAPEPVFQAALKTTALCGALWAANSDTGHPQIHAQGVMAHRLGSVEVPDSGCGIPNADTIYRFITVDGYSHYVIKGRVAAHRPIENNFTLASFNMTTIANVNGRDLQVDPDGTFQITIDPEPANGRRNHLQSRHDAFQVWIRDTLGDWSKERPNTLSVERLDPQPSAPVSFEGQQAMVGRYISYVIYSMPADVINGPANTLPQPKILGGQAGSGGFLVTQAYSNGRFELGEDQALVVNVNPGYAGYVVVPVTNAWGTQDGVGRPTGSLNNFQADRNPDGTYTFVIAKSDPGVANWVDTGGLDRGILILRWAAFPTGDLSRLPPPAVSTSLVKVGELPKLLPAARHVTSAEREKLREARRRELYRRLSDD